MESDASKKTAGRRTSLGCLGVCGLLILFGLPVAIPLLRDLIEETRIHTSYVETRCTVVNAELIVNEGSSSSSRNRGREFSYRPRVQLLHRLDGKETTAFGFASRNFEEGLAEEDVRGLLAQFPAGQETPCFVDPGNPSRAVLVPDWGDRRRYLLLIPCLGAVLLGVLMGVSLLRS